VRILVADDDLAVQAAYKAAFRTLAPNTQTAELAAMAASLFADDASEQPEASGESELDVTYVTQGQDAAAAVAKRHAAGTPFQLVFLDMRMPPGIDGRETARLIRAADPDINIVMVTGYSDSRPVDVAKVAGPANKLFYIAKPFEVDEILQLSRALSEKWRIEIDLKAAREALEDQVRLLEHSNRELALSEARSRHIGLHDALTGAPNRAAFFDHLGERIRTRSGPFAVAILDLDRFKAVNDTLGHAAGDELIRSIWKEISAALPPGAHAARLGGDEFGIVLPSGDATEIERLCESLIACCVKEYSILGHAAKVGASVGAAAASEAGERDAVDIVRRADLALYAAKRAGRGQVRMFDQSLDESARFRHQIEVGLREAIANGELSLVYQPIVRQDTLEVVGFEALSRWESKTHGTVPPSVFVPIAEESSLIHELGDWVLPRALEACRSWNGQYVSINFSPRQFHRAGLAQSIRSAAERAGLPPGRVQVEITETALFDDPKAAAEVVRELQELGFRVALDDFGTGYSSLFNLQAFNVDCIKIDQSFIAALGQEGNAAAIVSSITHLARSLGMGVIAEGVEDSIQHQSLRLAGASHMQGFLFGRPTADASAPAAASPETAAPVPRSATG
jgi:diguanylate cyclase (GGDEF)-like protein